MTYKPVIALARAAQDVQDALTYYLTEASEKAAMDFVHDLGQAFYMLASDHIDVWRVLHARRDIPSWLSNTVSPGS